MQRQIYCENLKLPQKEAKQTNIRKGNVILVKVIANSIFLHHPTNPGAIKLMKIGIKSSMIKTKNKNL